MSKRGKSLTMDKAKRRKRTSKKKELDINLLVNIAVKTGKTVIGTNSLKKYINTEDLKTIILSKNCPSDIRDSIKTLADTKEGGIQIYTYPFSSWELGTAAGKPFMVASLGIIDQGDSRILEVIQKNQKIST